MLFTGGWGTPTADQGLVSVRCWDDSSSILIVVADSCPCIVKDANGTITGSNPPCCGDIYNMCARLAPAIKAE